MERRVVLAVDGTRGDVGPMLGLGAKLRAAGWQVQVLAPSEFADAAQRLQLDFESCGVDVRKWLADNAGAATEGGLRMLGAARSYMRATIRAQFAGLVEAARGADLIVAAGINGAASSVAEMYGIPYRYTVYCPALLPDPEHPPVFVPGLGEAPRWVSRLLWLAAPQVFSAMIGTGVRDERRRLGLPRATGSMLQRVLGERPLLACDPEIAPPPPGWRERVDVCGSLHPVGSDPLPDKVLDFLDAGPAPVYFGFGSMPDPDPAATTAQIAAAIDTLGCRAIVSGGWAELGEGPLPDGVLRVGPLDHGRLFPRMAAIVHHGGAGTTTEAARAGVPQWVVPHVADQSFWGTRVWRLGLGLRPLPRKRLNGALLASGLCEILDNEILAARAAETGRRMRAWSPPDPAALLAP